MIRNSFVLVAILCVLGCGDKGSAVSKLLISFDFNEAQQRLNNLGQVAVIPEGHAAQTPAFRAMSVHYIELLSNALTPVGQGIILYKGPETTYNGETAIDFDKNIVAAEGDDFLGIDLSQIPAGTYPYIRVSVAFQQYDIVFNIRNVPFFGDLLNQNGTIASFLGYNTYISKVVPLTKTLEVNAAKKQGFWAFETILEDSFSAYNDLYSGQAPEGATTVVNPFGESNPIPAGSCLIAGQFATPLVIPDQKDKDIKLVLSFSANKSFEWIDFDGNGQLDFDAANPNGNDRPVDMGLRGLVPKWE